MKRCWFGVALLVVLLIGGLLVARTMTEKHEALSARLDSAARAAAAENWAGAEEDLTAARERWEQEWHFVAAFADHEPMEDIDSLFAQAEVFLQSQNPEALAALCAQLSKLTEAIGEAHVLNWWNML